MTLKGRIKGEGRDEPEEKPAAEEEDIADEVGDEEITTGQTHAQQVGEGGDYLGKLDGSKR